MFKILLAPDSGAAGGAGDTGDNGSPDGNAGPQGGGEGLKPEELKAQLKAKEEELVKLKEQEKLLNAPKPDELAKQLESKEEELKKLKADRDGQARRVSAIEKEMAELRKQHMSEEERKKAEESERSEKQEREESERMEKFLGECVGLAAERCGIKEEDRFILAGKDQDEIFKKGKRLMELIAEAEKRGYEKASRDAVKGSAPVSASGAAGEVKLGKTIEDSLNLAAQATMGI